MPLLRCVLVACLFTTWIGAPAAYGSPIMVHRTGSTFEDGIPGLDPDAVSYCNDGVCVQGTRDGQTCSADKDCPDVKDDKLRWQAGFLHVASDNYTVAGPYDSETNLPRPFELIIEPGAIVKISATCTTDSNDAIVSCQPQAFGGGQMFVSNGSVLSVDGATITDIRDDSVGGDTNNDGSATTPAPSYVLRFGGSEDEALLDSTIKYAALVGHFGSMPVEGNTFLKSGGAGTYLGSSIYNTHPPVRGSVPSIINNSFEFVSGTSGPGVLDVRGQSAIVWGNEFTGNAGSIVIGPIWENPYSYKNAMPEDGVTVVAQNNITTKEGIGIAPATATKDNILQQVRFRADIHDNHLVGPAGGGNIGLGLAMFTDTTVTSNTVENYTIPFQLRMNGVVTPPSAQTAALIGLHVHQNSFALTSGAQTGPFQFYEAFWKDFQTTVDAENNWWGHLTGPKDASDADGLVNARGLGLPVSNGIDYAPFLGGEAAASPDSIDVTASAFPPPPLAPDSGDVAINVAVDHFTLASASTGTVTIHVRNSQGYDLVTPVSKSVKSSDHQVAFDPITLPEVPRFTSAVVVEAALAPDNSSRDEIRSKPKLFPVTRPKGIFALVCVDDPDAGTDCDPLEISPGDTSKLALRFTYSFPGTVHGHVTLEERTIIGHELVRSFPTINFTAPASTLGSVSAFTTYRPELLGTSDPLLELSFRYWAEDDGGIEIASDTRSVGIYYNNHVTADVRALDAMMNQRDRYSVGHLLVGEHPTVKMDLEYNITPKSVTNWRIELTPMVARSADGTVLHTYDPDPSVLLENLATGKGTLKDQLFTFGDEPVLPPGTTELRFSLQLYAPTEHLVVDRSEVTIPVRDAERVVTKTIPGGASTTSFTPVPVEVKVTANPSPGILAAEEFLNAITNLNPAPDLDSSSSNDSAERFARAAGATRLIPLNRYFSLYDGLSDTGLTATVTFGYDPTKDFPGDAGFNKDSLVVVALNPLSGVLEALPSTHDKVQHKVTAAYDSFFGDWTIASQTTAPAAACADPTADGKTTTADALLALRASVGTAQCAKCICDVNKNGTVTTGDALIILKVAVGLMAVPTCVACG